MSDPVDDLDDQSTPFRTGMSCGCHGILRCERHQAMTLELARRYQSAKSSTALEKASQPASSSAPGTTGPR